MIEMSDALIPFIHEKMIGKCRLEDGFTLEDDIAYYQSVEHKNFITTNGRGFLCVMYTPEYIFIPYAWRDNSHEALKEMVMFAKLLYKRYTIENKLPIYYTGPVNFYKHHSVEIGSNIWQLEV